MEDYFPITTYRTILIDDINSKTKIKDFQQLSKETVKGIINSNYKKFVDIDFSNFEIFLDGIIELQSKLRTKKILTKKLNNIKSKSPSKAIPVAQKKKVVKI